LSGAHKIQKVSGSQAPIQPLLIANKTARAGKQQNRL
jgi:hypothetical protein